MPATRKCSLLFLIVAAVVLQAMPTKAQRTNARARAGAAQGGAGRQLHDIFNAEWQWTMQEFPTP